MKARNLLAQREAAHAKTIRQIEAVTDANEDGRYNSLITQLEVKERRQRKAVEDAKAQLEVFAELDIDF